MSYNSRNETFFFIKRPFITGDSMGYVRKLRLEIFNILRFINLGITFLRTEICYTLLVPAMLKSKCFRIKYLQRKTVAVYSHVTNNADKEKIYLDKKDVKQFPEFGSIIRKQA